MGTPYNNTIITINLMQRQTPTECKGYYLITRAWTSINRLSLALTVEFCIHRSPKNCPGYLCGRLWVVKHWHAPPSRVAGHERCAARPPLPGVMPLAGWRIALSALPLTELHRGRPDPCHPQPGPARALRGIVALGPPCHQCRRRSE
jgi:hypothetical protein